MLEIQVPYHELTFETTRSRGAGGQHVNKTESAVILRWNLINTESFPDEVKYKLIMRLRGSLNSEGELLIRSQESRSQKQNKDTCVEKLLVILKNALREQKKRIKTNPTRSSQRKRVEAKKHRAEIKSGRQKPKL
jgi:ribosome-associated protein